MSAFSSSLSLAFASQQVVIYVGIFLFIAGIIGGPLVLLVFLSLRTFRENSCAFYLTIMSIVNTLHLFTGILTFIMIDGFAINWPNMSIFYCKFRSFYVQLCVLTSMACMCLAVIDQFLATCSHPRWHQWNNIKVARYMVIGIVIVGILHGIPFLLYNNHILSPLTGQTYCAITNTIFQKYYSIFYYPILVNALPIITMMFFGIMAYRNVQQIAYRTVPLVRRELDKQLTTMVLVQVLFDVLAGAPIVFLTIYNIIINPPSNSVIATELGFIENILVVFFCSYYVVSIHYIEMPIKL
jgi:hypothetical protein